MTKAYRILFHGIIGNIDNFKAGMARLGIFPEIVDNMIEQAPVILKGGISFGTARRYAGAIQEAGGKVTIKEHGHLEEIKHNDRQVLIAPFQDFIMCPECGMKQQKQKFCIKCGFRLQR